MIAAALFAAALVNWADAAPVPGQCSAPASENVGKPGCYKSAEITLDAPPPELWWHIYEFESAAQASAAGRSQPSSATTASHGRHWLFVLGARDMPQPGGAKRARIGPLSPPTGAPVTARFMESFFTPGMRTRVHSHAGYEAFYIVDGEQCVETPTARAKLKAGDAYVVSPGPHVQAAAKGRRNMALVLTPPAAAWMTLEPYWTPTQYCAD